ncbi:MAG: DUF2520 domain-containing protein [Gammaproteobacteria bacterium]|nr:DUF2520 domain-containing protein [Gammaproteobacteria bacterium]
MRQVPHFLLIGNGRVARHFQHYFKLLSLSFETWHRQEPLADLYQKAATASHILLLISDKAIPTFIEQHLKNTQAYRIHFSGSLVTDLAFGAHPLMTFNTELYELKCYQSLSFVLDHDAPDFSALLPGLANASVRLHTSLKPKYHAFCVLSGNFSCLLWQKFFSSLEQEFHIPPAMAYPYLFQITQNISVNPNTALTGPLVRNDKETIEKNLMALQADPFQKIYQSFVDCYRSLTEEMLK